MLLTSISSYSSSILRAFWRSRFWQAVKCYHGLHPEDQVYTFPGGKEWRCMKCRKRWNSDAHFIRPF
jgi:hypothetical protein